MKANCIFVSVWDGSTEIRTPAYLDKKTGRVESLESVDDVDQLECLDREFVELPDGEILDVCKTCHEFVLRPAVDLGKRGVVVEGEECPNPDCDNKL